MNENILEYTTVTYSFVLYAHNIHTLKSVFNSLSVFHIIVDCTFSKNSGTSDTILVNKKTAEKIYFNLKRRCFAGI